ncbi:hypothetical protein acsn021_14750 [Anaerocolumna cellulosilytica]|uniref:Uncharacterized protein n=1 Tax=Anaerocolumna cellulosilytica TaxID=433286 RepID=A0A6S6QW25_9FIRM|nr:hypothetical protein acsn021_14750 [Anaerocolumna cellulosilytica]
MIFIFRQLSNAICLIPASKSEFKLFDTIISGSIIFSASVMLLSFVKAEIAGLYKVSLLYFNLIFLSTS